MQVLDIYGYEFEINLIMVFILVPILLPCLITNLKYLAFCSGVANICMATGIGVVFYYAGQDLPHPSERQYVGEVSNWPLFFGTAIFAYEGIALVSSGCALILCLTFSTYTICIRVESGVKL